MQAKVAIEELSRYLDGEVTPAERADIERRLGECRLSAALLGRLRELTETVGRGILIAPPPAVEAEPAEDCPDDSSLLLLADGKLAPAAKKRLEEHVAGCARCMRAVLEHLRSSVTMAGGRWPQLPPEVAARKELGGLSRARRASAPEDSAGEMVIDLGQDRKVVKSKQLGDHLVEVTLIPLSRDQARLELVVTLRKDPLAKQGVSLANAESGRKFYGDQTDAKGKVVVKRLPAGLYRASLDGREIGFNLTVLASRKADT